LGTRSRELEVTPEPGARLHGCALLTGSPPTFLIASPDIPPDWDDDAPSTIDDEAKDVVDLAQALLRTHRSCCPFNSLILEKWFKESQHLFHAWALWCLTQCSLAWRIGSRSSGQEEAVVPSKMTDNLFP
jgi:hypothetical protein